jgi:hypothetical protein
VAVALLTKILLAFRSKDVCAFPGCCQRLTSDEDPQEPKVIGEAAHICGEHLGSARFDDTMTDDERNCFLNLIYLCPTHHRLIDKEITGYSVQALRDMKEKHESSAHKAVLDGMEDVGFRELEIATNAFAASPPSEENDDFRVIPPEDKIRKNDLSNRSTVTIRMGLALSAEVSRFLETITRDDPDFPERLKSGFLEEYFRLRKLGIKGDDLFDLMCRFSQRGLSDQSKKSAGLAVLMYLFEQCEVFEK